MSFRCRIGRHDWLRVEYHHRPTVHDGREYGGMFYRCADCRVRPRRRPRRSRVGERIETGWNPGELVRIRMGDYERTVQI